MAWKLFRETPATFRLVCAVLGALGLPSFLALPLSINAGDPFVSAVSFMDMLLSAAFFFLALKGGRFIVAHSHHIREFLWGAFAYGALVNLVFMAITVPVLESDLATERLLTFVDIGISFLITAYLAYSVRRIAETGGT